MMNMKIERIFADTRKAYKESEEAGRAIDKSFTSGAHKLMRAYMKSVERGFDEIVFDNDMCIFDNEVAQIVEFCKEVGIGWFVFGSGYSGAMETMMLFVEAGARVGKFVVKKYKTEDFGTTVIKKVPGMRINL